MVRRPEPRVTASLNKSYEVSETERSHRGPDAQAATKISAVGSSEAWTRGGDGLLYTSIHVLGKGDYGGGVCWLDVP